MVDRQSTTGSGGAYGTGATQHSGQSGSMPDQASSTGGTQRSGQSGSGAGNQVSGHGSSSMGGTQGAGQTGSTWGDQPAGGTGEAVGGMVDTARQKADQVVGQVTATADAGIDRAATGLDRAAEMLRERASGQGGQMESVATAAAEKLDAAAHYLQGKQSETLIADLEAIVRRRPTESLLVALGIGFLLSKAMR